MVPLMIARGRHLSSYHSKLAFFYGLTKPPRSKLVSPIGSLVLDGYTSMITHSAMAGVLRWLSAFSARWRN
jgi:hypothetical protein